MLAVHLDLTGKTVLVVGGGPVGRRKAETLLAAGAAVRLVAPEPQPEDWHPPGLTWLREPVIQAHLAGVALVVTAANPEVDAQVTAWAKELGLWVNAASIPEAGDLTLPATLQRGRLVVSVSTQGAAPALAARILSQVETVLPESLSTWLDLLDEARTLAKERILDPARRRSLALALAELDGPSWLAAEGVEHVRAQLQQRIQVAAAEPSEPPP